MVQCHEEADNRLSHALATAEERHEQHCATLLGQIAKTQEIADSQAAQIAALTT